VAFGEPEVGQVRVLLAISDRDQDVRRLDIAVHEAPVVCCVERRSDLCEQLDAARRFERAVVEQQFAQVDPGHIIHRQKQQAALFTGVMDPDHMLVAQRGGDSHLALKAQTELLIIGELGREHLQRVDPVQRDIGRAVHDPHPALADQPIDAITADHRATLQPITADMHSQTPRSPTFRRAPKPSHSASRARLAPIWEGSTSARRERRHPSTRSQAGSSTICKLRGHATHAWSERRRACSPTLEGVRLSPPFDTAPSRRGNATASRCPESFAS
jgi:hypothetical protein